MTSLARRERHALCDLALVLGPDAPTLCDGWDARELVAHLLVRENDPVAAAGIPLAPLAGLTRRAMAKAARRPFPAMVARLRDPGLTVFRLPVVERLANTLEYLVHHEDLRRGQPSWEPRVLPVADEDEVWKLLRAAGRVAARRSPVPLVVLRSDHAGQTMALKRGSGAVTVTGTPSELAMMLLGRHQLRGLDYDGPPAAVARLQAAELGY